MSQVTEERALSVHHWNDSLFSFKTTRAPGLRFRSGHFVMLGLPAGERPLLRAYSVASAHYEDHLEFYSIKVEGGPLTSRLSRISPGDPILVGRKPTGTLVLENLLPGRRLYLLATGTGLAPFLSVVRDPEVYERFDEVVLVHGVRRVSELGYSRFLDGELAEHPLVGEDARRKLRYVPTVTREPFERRGRITDLLESGALARELGLPELACADDRVMLCGSPSMLRDTAAILEARGLAEGSNREPGHYVVERAFVEG